MRLPMLSWVLVVLFAGLMLGIPAAVVVSLWKESRRLGLSTIPLWLTFPYFAYVLCETWRLAMGS